MSCIALNIHMLLYITPTPCPHHDTPTHVYITKFQTKKQGLDDGRVAFIGEIKPVPKEEAAAARETYLARHPGHFWVRACFTLCGCR